MDVEPPSHSTTEFDESIQPTPDPTAQNRQQALELSYYSSTTPAASVLHSNPAYEPHRYVATSQWMPSGVTRASASRDQGSSNAFAHQGYLPSQTDVDHAANQLPSMFNYMYLGGQPQNTTQPPSHQRVNTATVADHGPPQYSLLQQDMRFVNPMSNTQHFRGHMMPYPSQTYQHVPPPLKGQQIFQAPYVGVHQHPGIQYTFDASQFPRPYVPGGSALSPITTSFPSHLNIGEQVSPILHSSYVNGVNPSGREFSQSGKAFPAETQPTTPRGPPRKPRQSGYALWVGNLPPGAKVEDLKDHFSREATHDIESIKLISKSNCAFVNYRTEEACSAAITRFQEIRFQGTRLVCRLRRGSTAGVTVLATTPTDSLDETPSSSIEPTALETAQESRITDRANASNESTRVPERFFILKSLTLQDLETSVRNGIWATQSHNEKLLNEAYDNSDTVFLIFSANKSGEYFGYARMASSISQSNASIIPVEEKLPSTPAEVFSSQKTFEDVAPKSIPTAATEWAPKGYIIDDSARGTIFWEADLEEKLRSPTTNCQESEDEQNQPVIASSTPSSQTQDSLAESGEHQGLRPERQPAHGTPFHVEWISTRRLPFHRTRGLRNPWNANREVKIARDGTELEPGAGNKLIALFMAGPHVVQR